MAIWDGFYSFAGIEFANEERFRTYIQNVAPNVPIKERSLDQYAGTYMALGDVPYSDPLTDRAPWVDLDDPITHDFLGLTILSQDGVENSTLTAGVVESLGRGGTVGSAREGTREVRFTALLVGLTAESVQSGFSWLQRTLWASGNERPLVPDVPGVSDLRFFAQRPVLDPSQVMNLIRNPTGSDLSESLVGAPGQGYAFRVPNGTSGDWAYRVSTRVVGDAEAYLRESERPVAQSGQQWVASARIWRDASVLGHRQLNLLLRFRDQYGNIILGAGPNDTSVPDGVLYRWTGAKWDSVSQRLDINGMIQNFVVNPSAEGSLSGLGQYGSNAARATVVPYTGLSGARAYQLSSNSVGDATVQSQSAPAQSGQQWWGRARARLTAAYGSRTLRADLLFRDGSGSEISRLTGTPAVRTPAGVLHRWVGARNASVSEEITGTTRRRNYNPNPTVRDNLNGYTGQGNVTVARERFPHTGVPQTIRVTPNSTGGTAVAGVNLPVTNLPLGEYDVVFTLWTDGAQTLRFQGDGWRATGDTGADTNNEVPVVSPAASTSTVIKIHITVTKPNQVFRIARAASNTVGNTFRVTRIGFLTGGSSYFDGDTGLFEYEGIARKSSSVAHRTGDSDAMNMLLNSGFEDGITYWSPKTNTAVSYDKANRRLLVSATGLVSGGAAFVEEQAHTDTLGGSRLHVGAHIYNLSSAAVTVAAQMRWEGSVTSWLAGPSVTIPAGGDAWVTTAAPIQIPGGVSRVIPQFVTLNALPSGTVLAVKHPFMVPGLPSAAAPTELQWFDGETADTDGASFDASVVDLSVGGIAPNGAKSAALLLSSVSNGLNSADDRVMLDQVMLTQFDTPDDGDPGTPLVPVLPDYFDGSMTSTFNLVQTFRVDSDPGTGVADTTVYNAQVVASAPPGAVRAEVAVQRAGQFDAAVGDVIYADNLMLASYEGGAVPQYTRTTRHDLVAETERWAQEVYPVSGPTVIQNLELGANGCDGYAAQVEFTVTAENPSLLRDSVSVPLPLPSTFTRVEDLAGVVKNYMPQFGVASSSVPSQWTTTQDVGVTTVGSYQVSSISPRVLTLTSADANTRFGHYFRSIGALGTQGGFENAVASLWIGSSVAGAKFTITINAHNGNSAAVGNTSVVWTAPDVSNGDILNDAHRVNLTLPASTAGGATDGFILYVHPETAFGTLYLGIPQVTLTSVPVGMIYGGMPDDGTYTYGFDGAGFSTRKPTPRQFSNTVFPNLTAPPTPISQIGGYNEVGASSVRAYAAIPADVVPSNAVAVPVVRFDFERMMTRQARVRFYPNPRNVAPSAIDVSSWEYEWVVEPFHGNTSQYASAGFMSLVIDGVAERVFLRAYDGTVIPGEQYVTTSDGAPIGWPEFRRIPWVVSVDYPTFHMSSAEPLNENWWRASMSLVVEE